MAEDSIPNSNSKRNRKIERRLTRKEDGTKRVWLVS